MIAYIPTIEKPSDFLNKPFPQVRGQSLAKKEVVIPDDINNGMRSGIPKKDWAAVVPIFGDASRIIEAIGNERPQSAHVRY